MVTSLSRSRRLVTLLAALLLAAFGLALIGADRADAARSKCPSTFRVLHNDTIGKLKLPKGHYKITLFDDRLLSCAGAADLFAQFLEDYDGKLPDGWRVRARSSAFFQPKTGDGFKVQRVGRPNGGGGGGGNHPATGKACPALFRVLHNDRIGRLKLPAGQYRISVLRVGRLSCDRASKLFTKFLQRYDGNLPNRWKLDVQTATFQKSRHVGFRVKQVR